MMPPGADLVDLDRERRVRANLAELRDLLTTDANLAERTGAMLDGALPCPDLEVSPMADVSLTIRVPSSYPDRADKVLAEFARLDLGPDPFGLLASVRVSRSLVLRLALDRGLAALEAELATGAPATPEPAEQPTPARRKPDDGAPASAFLREYKRPSRLSKPATASAARLREWRQREALTQLQAAERLGVGQSTFSALETGKRQPTTEQAAKLEDLAGIPADAWTDDDGEEG